MTERQALQLSFHGSVAEIRLSRPELLNRFDMILHRELTEVLDELAADDRALAIVFCSTGKYFSAGGDTAIMIAASGDLAKRMAMIDEGRRLFRAAADFPKPLVVAMAGSSYGLGTSIALCGDAIVAHPGVEISDPHVQMALVAGDGGIIAWPAAMGMIRARRHLLTGDPIKAEDAYRLGVVTDLVDGPDDVLPAAHALAARIAALPPVAVQLTKRALNKVTMARVDEAFDLGFYLEAMTFGTEDLHEAIAAFKEKRPGKYKGR